MKSFTVKKDNKIKKVRARDMFSAVQKAFPVKGWHWEASFMGHATVQSEHGETYYFYLQDNG